MRGSKTLPTSLVDFLSWHAKERDLRGRELYEDLFFIKADTCVKTVKNRQLIKYTLINESA